MTEMERIMALIEEQGEIGAIPERNHYRATGPTRTMVHTIAKVLGVRVRTKLEVIEPGNKYLLWYRVVGS